MGLFGRINAGRRLSAGQRLLAEGKPSAARALLERALDAAPDDHGLRIHLALACLGDGEPVAGLAVLDARSGCFREPEILGLYRGILLLECGDHDAAEAALRDAAEAAPENRLIQAYRQLGKIQSGRIQEGVEALVESGIPENFEFQKRLALFLETQLFLSRYVPAPPEPEVLPEPSAPAEEAPQ